MNPAVKWIGGGTAAIVLLLGGLTIAANRPGATPSAEPAKPAAAAPAPAEETALAPEPVAPQEDPYVIKRVLPIEGPIKYGEWHWDDAGVADGPLLITVDLDARVISVFRNGYEIGAAAVLLGTDNHPTPLGTFPIMLKKRHNVSTIYGADMPFTMRLTNDGVAIHGAPVEKGYASHGCIGTPNDFAEKLFDTAKVGDKVVITRGRMVDVGHDLAGA
jgi:lipoprotein-anchoring transpeptidase ErfK/SrfK